MKRSTWQDAIAIDTGLTPDQKLNLLKLSVSLSNGAFEAKPHDAGETIALGVEKGWILEKGGEFKARLPHSFDAQESQKPPVEGVVSGELKTGGPTSTRVTSSESLRNSGTGVKSQRSPELGVGRGQDPC